MITVKTVIQGRNTRAWTRVVPSAVVLGLVACFLWLYYPHLGNYALHDWDESIYAQVARQSYDPFAFEWLGQGNTRPENLWFEKPPLVIWLIQLSTHVFGAGEFGVRAIIPLFAAGMLVLVFLWARDIAGSGWAGILSATAFFVIPHFLIASGVLTYDVPVAFFICAALFCYSKRHVSDRYVYGFWCAVGLGVLTKSIVGLLPLPIVMLDTLINRDFTWLATRRLLWGASACFALILPWHIIETIRFGWGFWHVYFYVHVFVRGTSSLENHGAPFAYYLVVFQQRPFRELALAGVVVAMYKLVGRTREVLLPLLALAVILLFFSVSVSKIHYYIIPVYPYMALLIGLALYWILSYIRVVWFRSLLFLVAVVMLVATGIQFNVYRLVRMNSPVYSDVKDIAQWITRQGEPMAVGYRSLVSSNEVLSGRPLLVYYLNRWVSPVSNTETFLLADQVYRTTTHVVYKLGALYYVVAVRTIP